MSIAVVITTGNPGTGATYLPVATGEIFSMHWLPAAARLGLVWMPLFQSGTSVPIEDFPAVRVEFERMRDYFVVPRSAAHVFVLDRQWHCRPIHPRWNRIPHGADSGAERARAALRHLLERHRTRRDGRRVECKHAERRAAQWLRSYIDPTYMVTPELEGWEVELHDSAPPDTLAQTTGTKVP